MRSGDGGPAASDKMRSMMREIALLKAQGEPCATIEKPAVHRVGETPAVLIAEHDPLFVRDGRIAARPTGFWPEGANLDFGTKIEDKELVAVFMRCIRGLAHRPASVRRQAVVE